jgi:hypothetical protein
MEGQRGLPRRVVQTSADLRKLVIVSFFFGYITFE